MPEQAVQSDNSPTTAEFQNKPALQSEATLQDVLNTMHDSDFFPRTGKDAPSRFWSAYERVAKQHDDEFLDRHNGELDVLLIFAGLFSAVSSTFIVNMQSSLNPSPSDTTNSLLKILINKIDNDTFPSQEAALPVWTGPSSTTIWVQTLAYTSLSTSLLAAFGAVLGKQWLGHFKTTRFGRGALHERCERRQRKLDGLETWHFSTIIAALPIFLQLSLLFFGIALAAKIWSQQHTVASVIMATTAFGVIFYFFTVVASLKFPDCPLQTPVSTVLRSFRQAVQKKGEERPKSWAGILNGVFVHLEGAFGTGHRIITKSIMRIVAYLSHLPGALRNTFRLLTSRPEAARGFEESEEQSDAEVTEEQTAVLEKSDLDCLESPIEVAQAFAVQSSAVQWILGISTDTDIVTAAARMVPEIEWPTEGDISGVLDRLKSHFYACFDPTRRILPLAQARAVACLKAMLHFYAERNKSPTLEIVFNGSVFSHGDHPGYYKLHSDEDFDLVGCATVSVPSSLDVTPLPLSERMWMAHMFTHRLHRIGDKRLYFDEFMISFIEICLDSESPSRLVADCLLLSGMLIGLQINQSYLTRLDKSEVIETLRKSVMARMLGILVDDISVPPQQEWRQTALKLLHPLLEDYVPNIGHPIDHRLSKWCFKLCLRLLEEGTGTPSEDDDRIRRVASLIHFTVRYSIPNPSKGWLTCQPAHLDLLVDYHLRICEETDIDVIRRTFTLLSWLGGSPSTQGRKRRYVETTIQFMGQNIPGCHVLLAACSVPATLVSVGRDDESARERFSQALLPEVLLDATQQAPVDDNPFKDISFFYLSHIIPYLRLLCVLSQEPTWHPQLHQNGHFDNCIVMADTLSTQGDDEFDEYAVWVAHIFAIINASGEEHPSFAAIQAYPSWPLILRAWKHIISIKFFGRAYVPGWKHLPKNYVEVLPSLVAYARERYDDMNGPLIGLVEQVSHKFDEEKQQRERGGDAQLMQENISSLRRERKDLAMQVWSLLKPSS